ncbi:unnamed protein product [Rhodiola kirilowii]
MALLSNTTWFFFYVFVYTALTLAQLSISQNSVKDYLAVHNAARAKVGVGPLSWNRTLAAYANKYAKSRLPVCELEHSQGPYGENLAQGYGEFSKVDAAKMWIGEKPNYDHRSNKCVGGECLHYTQVVWRNTVSIGCARVRCKEGIVFITCNYYPPGNYVGENPY